MMELRALEAEFRARMHKALKLDGADDYFTIPQLDTPTSFTFLAMINRTGYGSGGQPYRTIFGWSHSNWILGFDKNTLDYIITFSVESGWRFDAVGGLKVKERGWMLYGVVYDKDAKEIRAYRDLDEYVWTNKDLTCKAPPTYIGTGWPNYYPSYFEGLIAWILYYDIALSKSEIKHIYYNPFDPPCMEHLFLWLTPAGIDIANGKWWDLSGRNNHGTIYGATEVLLTEPEVVVL